MEKKSDAIIDSEPIESMVVVGGLAESDGPRESGITPLNSPLAGRNVNLLIHEWLTDMWLLTTGEDFDTNDRSATGHHGKPMALVSDGQMRLLGTRVDALVALREVGIEMS